jgi:hypothetical protein
MVKKEKIFELKITDQDDESGIDSISLVDVPAIEINWVAFNSQCDTGNCNINHDFSQDDIDFVSHIMNNAETEDDLLNEGWVIDSMEVITGKENFVNTDPNGPSIEDEKEYKVRYKYMLNPQISGPAIIETSRPFCRELIAQNKVFRVEDIEGAVNDFGQSPLVYRGSWNCRHVWSRIKYRNDAVIINKASINKGKVTVDGFPSGLAPDPRVLGYKEPSTITNVTKNAVSKGTAAPRTASHLGLSKQTEDEEFDYNVGSIGGYVDPGINKKKKKKYEEMFDYLYTQEEMSKQNFSVDSEEQQIVLGPAMIANQKIFRKGEDGQPYYVFFSPDTIKMIADKYMRNKYTDNNDQMHDGKAVKDVYVLESWIKEDMEYDKGNKYGYQDIPIGSWFVSMKINNPEIWDKIKTGVLNGFSVSGYFEEIAQFSREEMFLHRLSELLKVAP